MALIELSPETPAPPSATTPPPAYFYRRAGLALAAVLLLTLGGAAPVTSALFRRTGSVPVAEGGDFQLSGGLLYTLDPEAGPRELTAWQPGTGKRMWTHRDTGTEDPFFVSAATPGFTVLRSGRSVTVLDARTGAVRWTSATGVQPVTDRLAFVEEEVFRPGSEYDTDSGDPGRLYGSNTGALHTEPARRTELRGVDLATGVRQWTRSLPGSVFTFWTGAPADVIVVLAADQLQVLSPATGAVLRERAVPRIAGRSASAGDVVGDTILASYDSSSGGGPVIAYGLGDLAERWRQNLPDPAGNSTMCLDLICAVTIAELAVLDPATGAPRWRIGDTDVLAFGPDAVLQAEPASRPLRVVDAGTGRERINLDGWQSYRPVEGGRAYLLSRVEPGGTTAFGLLRQQAAAVQPLGRMPGAAVQCQAVTGLAACRVAGRIELWAIPA